MGATMTRWEYFWADLSEDLNELGAKGWEAVAVSANVQTCGVNDDIRTEHAVLLKRPVDTDTSA